MIQVGKQLTTKRKGKERSKDLNEERSKDQKEERAKVRKKKEKTQMINTRGNNKMSLKEKKDCLRKIQKKYK